MKPLTSFIQGISIVTSEMSDAVFYETKLCLKYILIFLTFLPRVKLQSQQTNNGFKSKNGIFIVEKVVEQRVEQHFVCCPSVVIQAFQLFLNVGWHTPINDLKSMLCRLVFWGDFDKLAGGLLTMCMNYVKHTPV